MLERDFKISPRKKPRTLTVGKLKYLRADVKCITYFGEVLENELQSARIAKTT